MNKKHELQKPKTKKSLSMQGDLLQDIRTMIEQARQSVAVAINSHLMALYWKIGHRIRGSVTFRL